MKSIAAAVVVAGALASMGALPAAGQAQWDERAVQGGAEFRLLNDEGAAIVLRCTDQEVHAGFVFVEQIEAARGALVIGQLADVEPGRILPPHMRHSFPVAQVSSRTVQVVSERGLAFTLALLDAATIIHVRTAGRRASFDVAGSDSMLAQCPGAEEWSRAGYGVSAFGRFTGTAPGDTAQGAIGAR